MNASTPSRSADRSPAAKRRRWLRRRNLRLRWTKDNARLNRFAAHPKHPSVRRDVVGMLLRTRQFRLAVAVGVLPCGYSIAKYEPRRHADLIEDGEAP